jgi:hypothetical protein
MVDDGIVTATTTMARMDNDATAAITAMTASGAKEPTVDDDVVTATVTMAMAGNNATTTITATMVSGAKGATVDNGIVTATAMTARTVYCPSLLRSTMSTMPRPPCHCPPSLSSSHHPPLMFRGVKLCVDECY